MVYFIALVVITLISSFSSALDTNSRAPIRDAELVGTWSSKSSTVETGPVSIHSVFSLLNSSGTSSDEQFSDTLTEILRPS
jgi:hypothetical protein